MGRPLEGYLPYVNHVGSSAWLETGNGTRHPGAEQAGAANVAVARRRTNSQRDSLALSISSVHLSQLLIATRSC